MTCPHDTIEVVDMTDRLVVWASDNEPLDPQPSFTQCEDEGCGQVFVRLTPMQDELVKWCTALGTKHLRVIPVGADADE